MKRVIRDLEAKQQAEALQKPLSPGASDRPATPEEAARASRLKAAQGELDVIDRQIAAKQAEEKRLRALMAGYQGRVEATPERESELTSLLRDYDTLRRTYEGLLAKQQDSKVSANLERRPNRRAVPHAGSCADSREAYQPEPAADRPAGRAGGPGHGRGARGAARVPGLQLQDRRRGGQRAGAAGGGRRPADARPGGAQGASPPLAAHRDGDNGGDSRPRGDGVVAVLAIPVLDDVRAILRPSRATVRPDAEPEVPVPHAQPPRGAQQPAVRHHRPQGDDAAHRRGWNRQDDDHSCGARRGGGAVGALCLHEQPRSDARGVLRISRAEVRVEHPGPRCPRRDSWSSSRTVCWRATGPAA